MRTFRDSSDVEWTVFEVRRANDESNWAYLPRGFRSGWLCFESTAGKRRLSPVPDGWKLLEPADLLAMLDRATSVGRHGRPDVRPQSIRPYPSRDNEANP